MEPASLDNAITAPWIMRSRKMDSGQLSLPLVSPSGFAGVREAIREVKKDHPQKDEALADRMRDLARLTGEDLKLTGATLAKITSEPHRISVLLLESFVKATDDPRPLAALCQACGFHLIDDDQMDKLQWAERYWAEKECLEERRHLEQKLKMRRFQR